MLSICVSSLSVNLEPEIEIQIHQNLNGSETTSGSQSKVPLICQDNLELYP